jgi:chorismate mutase
MNIRCRGVRGATTCEANTREAILEATREMVQLLIEANGLHPDDIASAIFTTTPDLNAEFPAVAARELGWLDTALLCGHEMAVPGSLPRCIRVLVHWNTERRADQVVHVYVRGAKTLRPERAAMTRTRTSPTEKLSLR